MRAESSLSGTKLLVVFLSPVHRAFPEHTVGLLIIYSIVHCPLQGEILIRCLINAQKLVYFRAIECPSFTAIEILFIINSLRIHVGDAYISKCSAAIWI